MDAVDFWTTCAANGIILDQEQMRCIERFHDEMLIWNRRVNLVSRKDMDHLYERHILHSLAIVKLVDIPPKARCLDVGTGGGFPGIPLKIARPDLRMLLLDSIAKKIKVTGMLAKHTGLKKIEARTARVEDLAARSEHKRAYDIVTARGVAHLPRLWGWTRELLKAGGRLLALKGGDLRDEIAALHEDFPEAQVERLDIDLIAAPSFRKDNKQLLVCRQKPVG